MMAYKQKNETNGRYNGNVEDYLRAKGIAYLRYQIDYRTRNNSDTYNGTEYINFEALMPNKRCDIIVLTNNTPL